MESAILEKWDKENVVSDMNAQKAASIAGKDGGKEGGLWTESN